MLDRRLRPRAQAALAPIAARCGRIRPSTLTLVGGALGVAAAVAAGFGLPLAAVALWVANRIIDGLDGVVARTTGRTSDAGGYLDMVVDVVVYASIPLGVAVGHGGTPAWTVAALLLASFSLNIISWCYLAALLEKRGRGATNEGESTSITMPPGLIEGTETIIAYTLLLAVPSAAVVTMAAMAALVTVGAVMRTRQGMAILAEK